MINDSNKNALRARKYKRLIEMYLNQSISANKFRRAYFDIYKNDPGRMEAQLFNILENLFFYADAYWHDVTPETETELEISEETLRREAASALEKIDQYILDKEREAGNSQ